MKKALLEQIHDEPERVQQAFHVGKSNLPRISYKTAMRSWILFAGAAYQVQACNVVVFQACVDELAATVKKPLCGALRGFTYRDGIDRWYAINVLLEHKATVPLFSTEQEAKAQASIAQVTSPQ